MRATNPPSEVIPTRSPMPSTETSTWVAPAAIASYAFAMAQPVSLWPWKPMSQRTARADLADERVDLARRGDPDRVGDADAVDAQPLRRLVDGEQVRHLGAERVLGGEADLEPGGERELDGRRPSRR